MESTTEWIVDRAREFIEKKGGYSFVQLEKVREDERKSVWKGNPSEGGSGETDMGH